MVDLWGSLVGVCWIKYIVVTLLRNVLGKGGHIFNGINVEEVEKVEGTKDPLYNRSTIKYEVAVIVLTQGLNTASILI